MAEFLLEIGTEEIPDWMIEPACEHLQRNLLDALKEADLSDGVTCVTHATPRRLVLVAQGVAERQADKDEILTGPPKKVAFGQDGKPTKAGEGFAKRAGVALESIKIGDDGRLFVKRSVKGRKAVEILGEALPDVILKVHFPKTMYWTAKSGPRFIRPIRWLVALLGGAVVPFEIAGVKSGAKTQGHRRLGRGEITVTSLADLTTKLREKYVRLSAQERQDQITQGCETHFSSHTGRLRATYNPRLLKTLTYMTEWPFVICGEFDRGFLELPGEILETVMVHHQRYFSVTDSSTGKLEPYFLAVANIDSDDQGTIRHGHERVLRARFNDAQFFWNVDQKKTLQDRVQDLKGVTYHAKLGTYYDKTRRVQELAGGICRLLDVPTQLSEKILRAAELAKCDLTTEMVGEFPELQGVVGGLYARAQGEAMEVGDAVYDHYRPSGANDSIPRQKAGCILSIADKMDTLGSFFKIDLIPTGSKDPFALRRAAYGVIHILIRMGFELSLTQLCDMAGAGSRAATLREFMVDRLRYYLSEEEGQGEPSRYDEINAVLAVADDIACDARTRLMALSAARKTPNFEPLATSFKRIKNILEQAGRADLNARGEVDEELLEEGAERDLYQEFQKLLPIVAALKSSGDYYSALANIASLRPAVDRFFDDVLVMAEDEAVRDNRLTFLAQLLTEFSTIANFAEIVSG